MYILGLNAFHGDSAACLLEDGKVITAIEEERIRRIKHWAGFPSESIKFCLNEAGITINDVEFLTIGRNPSAHFIKKMINVVPQLLNTNFLIDRAKNIKKVINVRADLAKTLDMEVDKIKTKIKHIEHHRAHLASSFFASNFNESAILSIDGFGDFTSTMLAEGKNNKIKVLDSVTYPHSLGIFYTAFTQFLGFPWYGDEYKVMGLAPYGEPKYLDKVRKVIQTTQDGLFKLDQNYFTHSTKGVSMDWEGGAPFIDIIYSEKLVQEFGQPRGKDDQLTQYHKDIAASVQMQCENVIFHILNNLQERTNSPNICIAGGVAQNSVANGKIIEKTKFQNVYIPSAGYDAGTSVGSALYMYNHILNNQRGKIIKGAYYGNKSSNKNIESLLKDKKINYTLFTSEDKTIEKAAKLLANGAVLGWFQGCTEFGPRALGNRSVLVHPGRQDAKELINSKIKRRESFRPFAPSILREYVNEFFESEDDVFFMEKVFKIRQEKRKGLPAVTHVDGSGRLQTVHKDVSPKYYALIDRFREITGLPILLNTSFNENEPIVNTPEEALDCFLRTEMDVLIMEDILIERKTMFSNEFL